MDDNTKKLLELHSRLKDVKNMKKSMARDYNDQIKEIEAEIEDLVTLMKDGE